MAPRDCQVDAKAIDFDVFRTLTEALAANTVSDDTSAPASPFDAMRLPTVSLIDYAQRLDRYCLCTEECHVLSLVYLERLLKCNPRFVISELRVHRLLLAATIVAVKVQDDDYYSNGYYAKVGGVSRDELMMLEAELLQHIGWRAHVDEEEFWDGLQRLRSGKILSKRPEPEVTPPPSKEVPMPDADPAGTDAPGPTQPLDAAKGAAAMTIDGAERAAVAGTDTAEIVVATVVDAAPKMAVMAAQQLGVARQAAALMIGEPGTQCPMWTSATPTSAPMCQRRPRRRSSTPVTHMNARRTRPCLVVRSTR